MRFSPRQEAIFDFVEDGQGNGIANAVAGSGKTTTIVEAFNRAQRQGGGKKAVFLAFNKSIVKELKERGVIAKTLNGLGYGALMRGLDFEPVLEADKIRDLIDRHVPFELAKRYGGAIGRLVGLAKGQGIVPSFSPSKFKGLTPDNEDVWYGIIDQFDIDVGEHPDASEEELITLARDVLDASLRQEAIIDFDDQKYLPVVMGLAPYPNDWIFLDECQDLNLVDRALVRMSLRRGGRIFAVGDPHQAIYGFRGADVDSFDRIKEEFQCTEFPLDVCYRCPTSVIKRAQEWVPQITAAPGAIEGTVEALAAYDHTQFKPRDWVLCRNNGPLISLAYKLMAKRVPVTVIGRDFGTKIMKLVRRLGEKLEPGESFETELLVNLDNYRRKEIEKAEARRMVTKINMIVDMCDSISVIIESANIECIADVENEMMSLFSDDAQKNAVILSTVHKAKGGQAPTVYILDWHLMPSSFARTDSALQQEYNLQYIAVTRAQEVLRFVKTDMFKKETATQVAA